MEAEADLTFSLDEGEAAITEASRMYLKRNKLDYRSEIDLSAEPLHFSESSRNKSNIGKWGVERQQPEMTVASSPEKRTYTVLSPKMSKKVVLPSKQSTEYGRGNTG